MWAAIEKPRQLRKRIEEVKPEIEKAMRAYDLNKVAELQYGTLATLERELQKSADKLLRETMTRLEEPGIEIDEVVVKGHPAQEVIALAEKINADLIAIGSRGRGAAARVLLGSVSDRVVHISDKPVLVIR